MAGKNFAFKEKSQKLGEIETITLENASTMTIFKLRQELTRKKKTICLLGTEVQLHIHIGRGVFDEIFGPNGEKRNINFESCLQVTL